MRIIKRMITTLSFALLLLLPMMDAKAGTIINVDAGAEGNTVFITGQAAEGVWSVTAFLYDETGAELIEMKSTAVDEENQYGFDFGVPDGHYRIKAADYEGGKFAETEVTVGESESEEPKPEDPKTEEPKPENTKTEEPKPEDPKTEESKPEEPKSEEPKPEDPKTEDPKTDGAKPSDIKSDGVKPSNTMPSAAPSTSEYVPIRMSTEKIATEVNAIVNAVKAGDKTVKITMDGATVVPSSILEAATGKDIQLVLDMGGYLWTIDGNSIQSSNLKDVDLKVNFDTGAIPANLVSSLAEENATKQISLAYNGDFGFKASLSFNIGSQYQGKYGNLYYYNTNGELVFVDAAKITSDGIVSLEFSHASDYLIVITEKSIASKTGDSTILMDCVLLIFAGITLILFVVFKKNSINN